MTISQVAFDAMGGGEEGNKRSIRMKEEVDHSLPTWSPVALLDGQVQRASTRDGVARWFHDNKGNGPALYSLARSLTKSLQR